MQKITHIGSSIATAEYHILLTQEVTAVSASCPEISVVRDKSMSQPNNHRNEEITTHEQHIQSSEITAQNPRNNRSPINEQHIRGGDAQ